MRLGIGIDTGGTYTDAIIYAFGERKILASAKALTTRDNLAVGILEALDGLPADLLREAEVLSLSTTLATNACVEDKGGSAKLIFFGGDKKIIDELGGKYGLPPANEMHIQEAYTTFTGEIQREPDWELFTRSLDQSFQGLDGAGIIEMNALKNNAVVEKKAKELFQKQIPIPVVCGHELFSELNCLQRGSSTLLNAKLFPVIVEFLDAIQSAMEQRGMNATIIIVRSDGSLMSDAFARVHPVETLLCGPAASVLGAGWLTGAPDSIVVDMGGTTTDLALIREGNPVKALDGVSIGRWKTFVDGLYIKTFGLGGDSAIHYDSSRIRLEEYRVVPLCVAAEKYPVILDNLKRLNADVQKHTKFLYEHYLLVKDISESARYSAQEQAFCKALKNGPLISREAAGRVGRDVYSLNVSRLLREGVIQICGFTPTDVMHIRGDFERYSKEASLLAAQFITSNLACTVEELCEQVYDEIKRKIYLNVVKVLLENRFPDYRKNGVNKDIERFINESYELARSGSRNGLLSMAFSTQFTLCGIGAPIRFFLEDVARMLGTRAVIPEHYEVANALGAVIGNVFATQVVEIRPNSRVDAADGYTVFGVQETRTFEELEEAESFAASEAEAGARAEAERRGARGTITVTCTLQRDEGEAKDSIVYLGTRAVAQAVGAIGFNGTP